MKEKYELLYGNRRIEAHKKLGMKTIRAYVKDEGEKMINLDLIKIRKNIRTNTKKEDLGPMMRSIRDDGLLHAVGVAKIGEIGNKDFIIINTIENVLRKEISPIELGKSCTELKDKHNMNISEIAARLNFNKTKIKAAMDLWKKLPKEFHEDIGYLEIRTDKKGLLAPTIVNTVLQLGLKKEETIKLLNFIKRENLAVKDLRLFKNLISRGFSISECFKQWKDFLNISVDLPFNRKIFNEMLDKNNLKVKRNLIIGILKGDIKSNKDLVV